MFNPNAKENYLKSKNAYLKVDFATVQGLSKESREEYKRNGFVTAEPLFKWIEKEWLEKGLSRDVVVCKKGLYYPVIREEEVENVTGYRGRSPITEKKKITDASDFFKFLNEYEEYKKTQKIYQEIS